MPTPTKGARLGGSPAHQRLILSNLAQQLFEHGKITTTEAKARRLRPYAEALITKAKVDTVANRRHVVKVIRDRGVLHTLFTEIGPAMATRPGGYTRITKVGPRKGDNAPMAVIEIVESKEFAPQNQEPKKRQPEKAAKPAAAAPVDEVEDDNELDDVADRAVEAAPADDSEALAQDEVAAEDVETDVIPGVPADPAENEPVEASEVEAAAAAVEEATSSDK